MYHLPWAEEMACRECSLLQANPHVALRRDTGNGVTLLQGAQP